ncbi:MAG: Ltp family lipoprotein [Synergistaceae bacterium]|nr:Ltp family lipoprotein [Synergistaceae bacterium]
MRKVLLAFCISLLVCVSAFGASLSEINALASAKLYLSTQAFSYKGLINQLVFEGYSRSEAEYAVKNCGADWNEQAAMKAKEYLEIMPMSRTKLIEQLVFEGFTKQQASYGVKQAGY